MSTKRSSDNLNDKGKTGAPVTTAPERTDLDVCPADGTRGNSPSPEWALVKLTLGWHPLTARCQWVHSGAGCLACQQHIHEFGHHVLWLGHEEVPLWCPRAWLHSSFHANSGREVVLALSPSHNCMAPGGNGESNGIGFKGYPLNCYMQLYAC